MAVDYPKELEITRPLFRYLEEFLVSDGDATDLEIPDTKFWIRMLLQPGEHDARYCRYVKSHLVGWNSFAFKAYASYSLTPASRQEVRTYFSQQLDKYSTEEVNEERFDLGDISFSDYSRSGNREAYPEDGFEIRCSKYQLVTWPWLELFLHMRSQLPRKKRLSLEFFNTESELT
jgi:hypothetical protein